MGEGMKPVSGASQSERRLSGRSYLILGGASAIGEAFEGGAPRLWAWFLKMGGASR